MPIYEYCCRKCGELTEVILKITDSPPKKCEGCGGKLEKQISNTTFILKGTGWYATDYGKKDTGGRKAAGNTNGNGGDGAGKEDISGTKKERAPEKGEATKESTKKGAVAPAK